MPKLVGVRERRHQPFYDTLFRADASTAPSPTVASSTRLFASGTNLSNTEWTNMHMAGALPSDNTFIILSIRCWLFFKSTNALLMYTLTVHQLYLNLYVGDKPQFLAPAWYMECPQLA